MNLQKLNNAIGEYKSFLKSNPRHDPYWKWESLKVFQENWDIDTVDFGSMFDRSLQNSRTRRLWKRENYAPKDMMMQFIALNSDYARFAFQDLFNEQKDIENRVDRFVFYCGEMLRDYKIKNPLTPENNHYHDDNYEIISLYLSFRYPDQYTFYNFGNFNKLMSLLGSLDVPKINDVGRYFKVMRTVFNFIKKDEEILAIHQQRLDDRKHFMGETLLIAEDFCGCVV